MSAVGCARARGLVARRRAGLSAAERLRLEEHLTNCEACAQEARALDAFAQMIDEVSSTGRPSRHARAITRVLNATSEAEIPAPSPPPRSAPYLLAGAMAAASVLGFAAYRAGWGTSAPSKPAVAAGEAHEPGPRKAEPLASLPAEEPPRPAAGDRLAAGKLRADGAPVALGAAVRPGVELATEAGAELALGPALVELSPGGRAMWDLDRTTLHLDTGAVYARVDPEREQTFRVVTSSFAVEVIGTEFEVTESGVRVDEGIVRITDPSGEVLAARIEAGESWDRADLADAEQAPHAALDVSASLARARSRLARDDVKGARALIREALASTPSRVERAEAETLLAECALVAGDRARAARRYLVVAETYGQLSAGENALFAAARLERDLGRSSRAAELFERYLDRYPNGRFRTDAELRLQEAHRR